MSITTAQTADQSNTTEHMDMEKANDDKSRLDTTVTKSKLPGKRTGYLDWHEYFMAVAFLSAQRSKDPRTQVGACIVNNEKKIVGIGYNGMPIGCSDDHMPWNRTENKSKEKWLESKTPYVCHAELNAVLNKNQADIKGCVIYVALFPCNMCAQIIIQSRISEVIYYSDKYHDRPEFMASRRMFHMAKVKYWQFRPRQKTITIDFDLIETTPGDVQPLPDKSQEDNCTVDVNITSSSGSDEAKISSDARRGDELLLPEGSALSQPQDLNPFQRKAVQQQRLRPLSQRMINNFSEVIFAIISAVFIVFLAVLVSIL